MMPDANFLFQARKMPGVGTRHSNRLNACEFRVFFGVSPGLCEILYSHIIRHPRFRDIRPKQLLWALHFLKCYSVETVSSRAMGACVRTYRDAMWHAVNALSHITVVSFYAFFRNYFVSSKHISNLCIDLFLLS